MSVKDNFTYFDKNLKENKGGGSFSWGMGGGVLFLVCALWSKGNYFGGG